MGAKKANNKNITDTTIAHKCGVWATDKGYKAIIKNTIENTIPNDFSDPLRDDDVLFLSNIKWYYIYYLDSGQGAKLNNQDIFGCLFFQSSPNLHLI